MRGCLSVPRKTREWDGIVSHFFQEHGELYLVIWTKYMYLINWYVGFQRENLWTTCIHPSLLYMRTSPSIPNIATLKNGRIPRGGYKWFRSYSKLTRVVSSLFTFSGYAPKKTNVSTAREAYLHTCMEAVLFATRLWLAHCRSPHKGTILKLTTVQFVNRLTPANKCPVYLSAPWDVGNRTLHCHNSFTHGKLPQAIWPKCFTSSYRKSEKFSVFKYFWWPAIVRKLKAGKFLDNIILKQWDYTCLSVIVHCSSVLFDVSSYGFEWMIIRLAASIRRYTIRPSTMWIRMRSIRRIVELPLQQLDCTCFLHVQCVHVWRPQMNDGLHSSSVVKLSFDGTR